MSRKWETVVDDGDECHGYYRTERLRVSFGWLYRVTGTNVVYVPDVHSIIREAVNSIRPVLQGIGRKGDR